MLIFLGGKLVCANFYAFCNYGLCWPGSLPADGEHVKAGGAAAAELDLADKENKNLRNN